VESESVVDVGVTLEVRLHRFKRKLKWGKEVGKDRSVGKARKGIQV